MGAYRSSLVRKICRCKDMGGVEERNLDLDCLFRVMACHSSLLAVEI